MYEGRSNVAPSKSPVACPMVSCACEVFVPSLAVTRNRYVRLAAGAGVRKAKVVLFVLPFRTAPWFRTRVTVMAAAGPIGAGVARTEGASEMRDNSAMATTKPRAYAFLGDVGDISPIP